MANATQQPVKLYNVVTEDDEILERHLPLREAEDRLCWHLNHDADAYLQDAE